MAGERLSDPRVLHDLVAKQQITPRHLPVSGAIGLDSMGPMRDSKTDALHPGIEDALGKFSETLREFGLVLVVATNGPDVEGEDILRALPLPVAAFAVTEGGGKLLSRNPSGAFEYTVLADEGEREMLGELERHLAAQDPLVQMMLEDRAPDSEGRRPIRTPYDTNVVFTLPTNMAVLRERARLYNVDLNSFFPEFSNDDYAIVLNYLRDRWANAIVDLGLSEHISVLVKAQNRRIYVSPNHIFDGRELSKRDGAERGSEILFRHHQLGWGNFYGSVPQEYTLGNSIYIADKVVDTTGEGQMIIGASERSMIIEENNFMLTPPDPEMNILRMEANTYGSQTIYAVEVACRLAVDVTMDNSIPRMSVVEGVPILHIGSGERALAAISELYKRLHG